MGQLARPEGVRCLVPEKALQIDRPRLLDLDHAGTWRAHFGTIDTTVTTPRRGLASRLSVTSCRSATHRNVPAPVKNSPQELHSRRSKTVRSRLAMSRPDQYITGCRCLREFGDFLESRSPCADHIRLAKSANTRTDGNLQHNVRTQRHTARLSTRRPRPLSPGRSRRIARIDLVAGFRRPRPRADSRARIVIFARLPGPGCERSPGPTA